MKMTVAVRRFLLASLVVALLAGALFTPGLPGEFVFDDFPNIVNNSGIHLSRLDASALLEIISARQMSGDTRGLPMLTFALDFWRAGGADPAAFKTTNIVIHAITAGMLAWFFRGLLLIAGIPARRVMWVAPALALAWAAHPLLVSSVLYTVQRLQTMGTLFLVLALLAYLQARRAQIEGCSGRAGMLLSLLSWVVALGCKEDSVLLPAYTLALELTVLRFGAANARLGSFLRRSYLIAVMAGIAGYLLLVVPYYWSWGDYPGRDFSTLERLLTQARLLCLYLWQSLLPLPQHMPFYYDWVQPSRGLLQPWTTLPAIALIVVLLAAAWRLRHRLPLFALGVFLFFSAHFVASNVVGLELAYEHRNHFALIGVVLAVGSLLACAGERIRLTPAMQAVVCATLLVAMGGATLSRAHDWRSTLTLARAGTEAAPQSPRAWVQLCSSLFKAGGEVVPDNPRLDEAILACSSGVGSSPDTLNSYALLLVLKTLRGDVSPQDWAGFQHRLSLARMSWDNGRAPMILTHYAGLGVSMDRQQVLAALATLAQRSGSDRSTFMSIGRAILNDLAEPDQALPYFLRAVETMPPGDPFPWQLAADLRAVGKPDLAEAVERLGLARYNAATATVDEGK